jgi:hypothetical protein
LLEAFRQRGPAAIWGQILNNLSPIRTLFSNKGLQGRGESVAKHFTTGGKFKGRTRSKPVRVHERFFAFLICCRGNFSPISGPVPEKSKGFIRIHKGSKQAIQLANLPCFERVLNPLEPPEPAEPPNLPPSYSPDISG